MPSVRCERRSLQLNRENSGTPLSHVLAIADESPPNSK